MTRDLAIRAVHTNVVTVYDGNRAYDANGAEVTLDESLIEAKITELDISNKWSELRKERNRLLAETDYLALSDLTLSAEMTTYRQALRDLPSNTSDPANPTWPTKPGS
ncbi:hypothetical protein [Synechococcus phage S-B05]|nr:hypothetical protein [Synechococcus phage S-B05]